MRNDTRGTELFFVMMFFVAAFTALQAVSELMPAGHGSSVALLATHLVARG